MDIIERAETELAKSWNTRSDTQRAELVPELIAALKAERAENERLVGIINHIGWPQ